MGWKVLPNQALRKEAKEGEKKKKRKRWSAGGVIWVRKTLLRNFEEGGGLDLVRRSSFSLIRLRGMGTHQDERSRQLASRRGRKYLGHTVEVCLGVCTMMTSGPEAWTHSGSAGAGAQGYDMAGDRSGNRLSNPNSSEGGRPEDGLRGSKGHLQLWRKGSHISGFVLVEVLTSAVDSNRCVGVEENAGATETEYATTASRG